MRKLIYLLCNAILKTYPLTSEKTSKQKSKNFSLNFGKILPFQVFKDTKAFLNHEQLYYRFSILFISYFSKIRNIGFMVSS